MVRRMVKTLRDTLVALNGRPHRFPSKAPTDASIDESEILKVFMVLLQCNRNAFMIFSKWGPLFNDHFNVVPL